MSLNKSYNYNIGTMGNINVTGLTTGTINASGLSTLINATVTNVSTGTVNASTGITAGSAQITNIVGTTISAGTLIGTTITGANLSLSGDLIVAGTLTTVNITSTNFVDTNISVGSLNASTGITAGTVRATSNLIALGNSNTLGSLYTTGGNVGIGITSPSEVLAIGGNIRLGPVTDSDANYAIKTSGQLNIVANDAASQNANFGGLQLDAGISTNKSSIALVGSSSSSFQYMSFSTLNTERIRITRDGNVGIGINSPSYKLDVNGSIRTTTTAGGLLIGTSTDTGRLISALSNMSANDTSMITFGQGNSANNQAELGFNYIGNGSTSNALTLGLYGGEKMRIRADGNIGIGTASPAFKLDVAGGVYCTDWFRSNGNTGWFNQTYGKGMYSTDTTWVRTFPDRTAFLCGTLNCNDITTNGYSISIGSGSVNFTNNGAGLSWTNNASQIYDDGDLRIKTDDTMHFYCNNSEVINLTSSTTTINTRTNINNNASGNVIGSGIYAPNIGGYQPWIVSMLGKTESTNYGVSIQGYYYAGSGSTSNYYFIGFNGKNYESESFKVYPGGSISIASVMTLQTSSPSSRGQIYFYSEGEIKSGGVTWLFGANSTLYGPGPYSSGSDTRIKENIVDVDDTSALAIIRQIQPKRYNYVDRQNRGDSPVWGFIAQQVASVLDYAVDTITQCIPNVYESASVGSDNHTITLHDKTTTDLVVGMKIRLLKVDKTPVETSISSIVDNKNFTVECDLTDVKNDNNKVFVYGVEVDDFHSLNKDAIFTIATAALQEVDRELQATKTELQTEKEKIARLEQFIQSKFPGEF